MGDLYILDYGIFSAEFIEISLSSLPKRIFLKKRKGVIIYEGKRKGFCLGRCINFIFYGYYNANSFATLVLYVFRISIIGYFLFWLYKEFKLYRYSNRRHEQSMKFLFKILQASKKVNRK